MSKNSRKTNVKVNPFKGWVLIAKEDDSDDWRIAWLEPFSTRKSALEFAKTNGWPKPFKAVGGELRVLP